MTLYCFTIGNALKYNDKAERYLEVGYLNSESGNPVLYVKDNGIGIDEKHFNNVFTIFEDYAATLRAFKKVGLNNKIERFEMDDDCLDYLFSRGDYAGKKIVFPGLILLDLNLPGTDGREVLKIIKSDPRLKIIPVVVLTTSNEIKDIEECYRLGANCYIQKPVSFEGFINAVTTLKEYWFEISILPK